MCFHGINGSGPTYLSELLHIYTPSRAIRSYSDSRMLKIQQYKRKTHGFRTFTYFGPYVWNSLPQDIRQCSYILKDEPENFPFFTVLPFQLTSEATSLIRNYLCVCVCVCMCVCVRVIASVRALARVC